jgi:hypothetical protein
MPPREPLQYFDIELVMIACLDIVLIVHGLYVAEHLIHVKDHEREEVSQSLDVQLLA